MKHSVVPEKSEIKYSEVVVLGDGELQTCDSDQDISCQVICNLQTYSTHQYSPVPVSSSQTPQNTRLSELFFGNPTRAKTTSSVDLSSCSYIYSNVLTSQTLKNAPTPYLSPSYCHAVSVNDVKMQPGGEEEPLEQRSDSSFSPTDELKTFSLFMKQCEIPASFSDFSSISQSTIILSHPAEFTSLNHAFSQSNFNSVPSLQPNTFTHPDASSNNFSTPFSPFLPLAFMDFSYCPVKCEPYVSLAV